MATKSELTRDGRWVGEAVYAACLAREEAAWRLVHAKALAVASYPRWNLKPADARDLAQQATLHLFERIEKVRDPVAFEAFVRTVTSRRILEFFRSSIRREVQMPVSTDGSEGAGPAVEPSTNPTSALMARLDWDRIHAAFELIPEDCGPKIRAWLDWRELGRYPTQKDLAAAFDQSLGTFSARVSRCLEMLRAVHEQEAA